nr:MAG TPA: hypothetical protein [Caudoviricetes sp.]DAI58440.1 MAG TPA: hypothetical protein [Crassvirales sp.]DAP51413.1 MAG TPA: hypothetical protein [Caudoviricetes sp.]
MLVLDRTISEETIKEISKVVILINLMLLYIFVLLCIDVL